MATLKLAVTPDKVAKDGSHKIRIALGHKSVTRYIVTRFKIDHLSQFKNGQIVKRPDAAIINTKLRNLLNEYQEKLDSIRCIQMYDCRQLREILINSTTAGHTAATFQAVAGSYITELIEDGRGNYAKLLERNCRYFTEFTKGEFLLSDITPEIIHNYARFLRNTKRVGETTIGMMMSRTRTIINRGVKKQLVKYDVSPFAYYSIKSYQNTVLSTAIENIDISGIKKVFDDAIDDAIGKQYIAPLVDTVAYLEKEDMADMAESLVSLTFLKRRMMSSEESVGGPVDVAIISKSDGFVWIKRKHYFQKELNHQFFSNYYKK